MSDPVSPDLVIDCRGLRCPVPVLTLARRIGEVELGQVVAVVAEDPAAAVDIPAWCRIRGHTSLGSGTAHEGVAVQLVRRER